MDVKKCDDSDADATPLKGIVFGLASAVGRTTHSPDLLYRD